VLGLCALQAALLAHTAWDKSDTADEPTYIAAAALVWAHRDYSFNSGAPVLPKWGFAAALRLVDPAIGQTPPEWYRAGTTCCGRAVRAACAGISSPRAAPPFS